MGLNAAFGKTSSDYVRYRRGFPDQLFDRLAALGIGRAGSRVLDLGTGTGNLARGFACRGARVVGLDPDADLIAAAGTLDREQGLFIEYVIATAEATGLADRTFDTVTAGQCWHWFDGHKAAAESMRLLRPGGWLVICHFDWLPFTGNVVEATERLIERHNPAWRLGGRAGIYPAWTCHTAEVGFTEIETFSFDRDVAFTHAQWIGRVRASAGVGASLPPGAVKLFEADLLRTLARDFADEPLSVPHRCWALVARRP